MYSITIARELVRIARELLTAKGKIADELGEYKGFTGKIVHPTVKKCYGYVLNAAFTLDDEGILFKGGTWKEGCFTGTFNGGTWKAGWFRNGVFDGGTWLKGDWQNGEWRGGYDKDGHWHLKDPKHFDEEERVISPKEQRRQERREEKRIRKEELENKSEERRRQERMEFNRTRRVRVFDVYQVIYVAKSFGDGSGKEVLKEYGKKKVAYFEASGIDEEKIDAMKKALKRESRNLDLDDSEIDSLEYTVMSSHDGEVWAIDEKTGMLVFVAREAI